MASYESQRATSRPSGGISLRGARRVAAAVPALVVAAHAVHDRRHQAHVLQGVGAPVGVLVDHVPLLGRRAPRFAEHARRAAHLADVVHEAGHVGQGDVLGRPAQLGGEQPAEPADGRGVPRRVAVAQVDHPTRPGTVPGGDVVSGCGSVAAGAPRDGGRGRGRRLGQRLPPGHRVLALGDGHLALGERLGDLAVRVISTSSIPTATAPMPGGRGLDADAVDALHQVHEGDQDGGADQVGAHHRLRHRRQTVSGGSPYLRAIMPLTSRWLRRRRPPRRPRRRRTSPPRRVAGRPSAHARARCPRPRPPRGRRRRRSRGPRSGRTAVVDRGEQAAQRGATTGGTPAPPPGSAGGSG